MPEIEEDITRALRALLQDLGESVRIDGCDVPATVTTGLRLRRRRRALALGGIAAVSGTIVLSVSTISNHREPTASLVPAANAPADDSHQTAPISTVVPGTAFQLPTGIPLPAGYTGAPNPTCVEPINAGFYVGDWHIWFLTVSPDHRYAVLGPDNSNPCTLATDQDGDQTGPARDPNSGAAGFYRSLSSAASLGAIPLPAPVITYGRAPAGTTRVELTDASGHTTSASALETGSGDYGVAFVSEQLTTTVTVTAYDDAGNSTLIPRTGGSTAD